MEFTEQELKAMRAEYGKGASDSQWELFISECKARNLRPGTHLVFQLRSSKEYDPAVGASVFVKKGYWITTAAALLLIAERTGKYDGASAPEYIYLDDKGDPTIISDIPLPDKKNHAAPREPWAVRVKVRRKDFSEPIVSTVRFDSVAATVKRGESIVLTDMWVKRGPEQNAKCSLANGIRLAFPEDAGHLYLTEEIKNEAEEAPSKAEVVPVPAPPTVPPVNQAPATATETQRPREAETVNTPNLPGGEVTVPAPAEKPARKPRAKKEQPPAEENQITDEDVEAAMIPTPPEDRERDEAIAKAVDEMVESASEPEKESPAPEDPVPSKEEMKDITAKIREIAGEGISNQDLKEYFLYSSGKTDPKLITKSEWVRAFEEFHKAKLEGRAKEFIKERK